ncbi:hypothetical protein FLL45_18450 [Aliikangiella marina]|uniref:Uncharacterized protein n=1 Tax=Aliikangiella marina TaxID=1712262 RepID=A0A545T4Q0_9GAMM|nr:hypothetical protein [Aliikangiella marina]TQV72201.1 hypothetical protein FLL45_18450 [Aliikangiella marina]
MYIRFVTEAIHTDLNQKIGIFHAIRYLRDDGELTEEEFRVADSLKSWFEKSMDSPFENMSSKKLKGPDRYISWFKDSAIEPIKKVRVLSSLIENKGFAIIFLRTKQPGQIVYEDDFQMFAKQYGRF